MPVDFRGGVITYDNLLWALEDPQIAEEPDLVEDLLQVSYGDGKYLLDVGRYSAGAGQGGFMVYVIGNCDWQCPLRSLAANSLGQLVSAMNDATAFIAKLS